MGNSPFCPFLSKIKQRHRLGRPESGSLSKTLETESGPFLGRLEPRKRTNRTENWTVHGTLSKISGVLGPVSRGLGDAAKGAVPRFHGRPGLEISTQTRAGLKARNGFVRGPSPTAGKNTFWGAKLPGNKEAPQLGQTRGEDNSLGRHLHTKTMWPPGPSNTPGAPKRTPRRAEPAGHTLGAETNSWSTKIWARGGDPLSKQTRRVGSLRNPPEGSGVIRHKPETI